MTPSKGLFPPLLWGPTSTSSSWTMQHLDLAPGSSPTSRWGPLAHQTSASLSPIGRRLHPPPRPSGSPRSPPPPFSFHRGLSLPFQGLPFHSSDPLGWTFITPGRQEKSLALSHIPSYRHPLPLQPSCSSDLPCGNHTERSVLYTQAHLVTGALTKCDLHWPHLRTVPLVPPDRTGL